ncbi:hypothetical protein PO903_13010 [Paenibacillus sp. PK4536]|nr:hypothetical protein [Paenibacillus sp. PK4536]WIM37575.1 hypothetical protein PO903_13010 [Paenibacillus sp. PK4536]
MQKSLFMGVEDKALMGPSALFIGLSWDVHGWGVVPVLEKGHN